jgi:polar amino acid transport system permease protein
MDYIPHWGTVWQARDALLAGARITLELTVLSMIVGTAIGMLLAIAKRSDKRWLSLAASSWIELARNTPCLFQIYMAYFGLGTIGLHLDSYSAVLGALIFNNAGYMAEIVRGGLNALPRTQTVAALSLGMRPVQAYLYVVLPQVLRIVYYPSTNQLMWALLNTSLGMTVGLQELSGATAFQQSLTFRAFEFFAAAAVIYYVLAKLVMGLSRVVGLRLFRE